MEDPQSPLLQFPLRNKSDEEKIPCNFHLLSHIHNLHVAMYSNKYLLKIPVGQLTPALLYLLSPMYFFEYPK